MLQDIKSIEYQHITQVNAWGISIDLNDVAHSSDTILFYQLNYDSQFLPISEVVENFIQEEKYISKFEFSPHACTESIFILNKSHDTMSIYKDQFRYDTLRTSRLYQRNRQGKWIVRNDKQFFHSEGLLQRIREIWYNSLDSTQIGTVDIYYKYDSISRLINVKYTPSSSLYKEVDLLENMENPDTYNHGYLEKTFKYGVCQKDIANTTPATQFYYTNPLKEQYKIGPLSLTQFSENNTPVDYEINYFFQDIHIGMKLHEIEKTTYMENRKLPLQRVVLEKDKLVKVDFFYH